MKKSLFLFSLLTLRLILIIAALSIRPFFAYCSNPQFESEEKVITTETIQIVSAENKTNAKSSNPVFYVLNKINFVVKSYDFEWIHEHVLSLSSLSDTHQFYFSRKIDGVEESLIPIQLNIPLILQTFAETNTQWPLKIVSTIGYEISTEPNHYKRPFEFRDPRPIIKWSHPKPSFLQFLNDITVSYNPLKNDNGVFYFFYEDNYGKIWNIHMRFVLEPEKEELIATHLKTTSLSGDKEDIILSNIKLFIQLHEVESFFSYYFELNYNLSEDYHSKESDN